jgi:hypothetical protein
MSTYCVKKEQAVRYIYTVTDWMRGVWRGCMTCHVSDDEETETWRDRCKTTKRREESTVPKNLTGTAREGVVWIDVRQVRDWWKTLVNMAMNLFLASKVRNSLTTLRPGNEIWRITELKDCHRCVCHSVPSQPSTDILPHPKSSALRPLIWKERLREGKGI